MTRRGLLVAALLLVVPSPVTLEADLPRQLPQLPQLPQLEQVAALIQTPSSPDTSDAPALSPAVEAVLALAEASGRYVVRCPAVEAGGPMIRHGYHARDGDQIVGMVWEPEGVLDVHEGHRVAWVHHWWTDADGRTHCELVEPESWTVAVRVLDGDGQPVHGAEVYGNGPTTTTDEQGRAEVEVLTLEGQLTWICASSGSDFASQLDVDAAAGEPIELVLEPWETDLTEMLAHIEQQRAEVQGALLGASLSDEAVRKLLQYDDLLALKASSLRPDP